MPRREFPWGELPGYDPTLARNEALKHTQQNFPHVGDKRRHPLVWEFGDIKFNEDADCWQVTLSCYPRGARWTKKGQRIYDVSVQGEILTGSPRLLADLEGKEPGRGPVFYLGLAGLLVALVGGGMWVLVGVGLTTGSATPAATATALPAPSPTPASAISPSATPTFTPTPTRVPATVTKLLADGAAGVRDLAFTPAEADEVDLTRVVIALTSVRRLEGELILARTDKVPVGVTPLPPGKVAYSYLGIQEQGLSPEVLVGVDLYFQVRRFWVEGNSINKSSVVLLRFSRGFWDSLETTFKGEDSLFLYYRATSPGFSYFAIAGEPVRPTPTPVPPPTPALAALTGRIAFASDRDGNYEIYVMNADGSGQTRLTYNGTADEFTDWGP